MFQFSPLLQNIYLGNTLASYIIAITTFIVLVVFINFLKKKFLSKIKNAAAKTKTNFDDAVIDVVTSLKPSVAIIIAFYFATRSLTFTPMVSNIIRYIFLFIVIVEAVQIAEKLVIFAIKMYLVKRGKGNAIDKQEEVFLQIMSVFVKVILWGLAILFFLSNVGVNVSSLIAGFGVGGIAIAFALQNILTDLFSSFTILFDRPFIVGDFIIVGTDSGVVQKIGLKTTKIKTSRGEIMIIPNKDLTSARINNMQSLQERREVSNVGVAYETKAAKLKQIPQTIKEIIESADHTRFDRCHLSQMGDSALTFEFVYYITNENYLDYMNAKQHINLAILQSFEKSKIDIAYPTQSIILKK